MEDEAIIQAAKRLKARSEWKPLMDSDFFPRIIVDRDGRIVIANDLALQLFDCPETLVLGHLVEEFMPKRFRERHVSFRDKYFEAPIRRAMGSGIELFILTRHGLEIRVDLGLAPLRIEEGTFVSITLQVVKPTKGGVGINGTTEHGSA